MAHDDDIPTPDAPESPAETAKARAFGELIEGMVSNRTPPPALASEDRALLETATMIRAGSHDAYDLPTDRRNAIIEAALQAGAGIERDAGPPAPSTHSAQSIIDELAPRRLRRMAPWAATAVAAAAAVFLWLRPPGGTTPDNETTRVADVPVAQRSRPADTLVGRIDRPQAGDASTRIDQMFADRSSGYRAVRFRRLGGDQ